mgnify:CR=1 FL=1
MYGPAPGLEKSQKSVWTWGWIEWEQTRMTWRCSLMKNSAWAGTVHLQLRKSTTSWAASKEAWLLDPGRGDSPWRWYSTLVGLQLHSTLGPQYKTWTCCSRFEGGPWAYSEGWSTSPMVIGWDCSAWRREGSRRPYIGHLLPRGTYGNNKKELCRGN